MYSIHPDAPCCAAIRGLGQALSHEIGKGFEERNMRAFFQQFPSLKLGELVLLTMYANAKFDNIPPKIARKMKQAYENP